MSSLPLLIYLYSNHQLLFINLSSFSRGGLGQRMFCARPICHKKGMDIESKKRMKLSLINLPNNI
jgi:hypothetical protein